jgi:hypothetical protein
MDTNINGGHVDGVPGRLAKGKHMRDVVTVGFTQSDLGEGEVTAVVVRDNICMGAHPGERACVDMAMLAAMSMTTKPFGAMPSDGIIGLGLESLASGHLTSFLGRLFEGSTNVVSQFGIAYGTQQGELHLGGHDLARLAAPLRWFPVDHPEQGYWQVAIRAVRIGNTTVDDCRHGCHGIVDSGVSRLGVQASKVPALSAALTAALTGGQCSGPDLSFDLGGMSLTLGPQDYADADCSPRLGSLDLEEPTFVGVYTFGGAVLNRYYAAFDWEQHKLGFAPLGRDGSANKGQAIPDELAGVVMI